MNKYELDQPETKADRQRATAKVKKTKTDTNAI